MNNNLLIRTENLRREFDRTVAVCDVNLQVEQGAIVALVGPNGAGKTTLLKMICGLLEPTHGTAYINGLDICIKPREIQKFLGFLPDFFGLYEEMQSWEYLDYFARAYRIPAAERNNRVKHTLEQVHLLDKHDSEIQTLSRGMRQRLAIARTLIHDPPLLLLDEPASGLDPESRHDLQTLFTELSQAGKTLVVSSHILSELEEYCTHVAIMREGKMIASGRTDEIQQSLGKKKTVQVSILGNSGRLNETLKTDPLVNIISIDTNNFIFEFDGDDSAMANLLQKLVSAGITVTFFGEAKHTIEDTYLSLARNAKK